VAALALVVTVVTPALIGAQGPATASSRPGWPCSSTEAAG
jgi:hypothetical protein